MSINKILSKCNLWLSRIFPRPFEKFAVKGKNLIGVEIGVYDGLHAKSMLKTLNIKKLYLIDPYDSYEEGNKHYGIEQATLEEAKKKADKLKARNVKFIRDYSRKAKTMFKDNSLDFVYIDGAHDYDNVKKDIENYYPKVKDGGVIGGHDIFNGITNEHDGVVQAVIEFAVKNKLNLKIQHPDYWIIKNGI